MIPLNYYDKIGFALGALVVIIPWRREVIIPMPSKIWVTSDHGIGLW